MSYWQSTRRFVRLEVVCILMAIISPLSVQGELVLFYDFNDASSSDTVVDITGNGNAGEVFDAEFTPDGGGRTSAAGDRAMDFGEYDNFAFVEVSTAPEGAFDAMVDNDQATVSMWIFGNEDQPSPQWTFFAGPDRQLGAHTPWDNGIVYFDVAGCCDLATQRIQLEADRSDWADSWNHYTFVKNEDYTAIYLNGELFHDSSADGERLELSEITEFYLGSGPPADVRSYNGLIDDFGVWDNALTAEEVKLLFQDTLLGGNGADGDFDGSGVLDAGDIDALSAAVRLAAQSGDHPAPFDLTGDGLVDNADRQTWVAELRKTWFGDANMDGEFNSADFVFVFATGQYEDATPGNSTWASGDWDGDTEFSSSDFVAAFTDGGYETGVRGATQSVPEPGSIFLVTLGVACMMCIRRM